jgi:purine nucleoside phosphorylase
LALKNAGCNVILVTTACGSLNENYKPGDLVILDDFIDRTSKRHQSYYDGTNPTFFNRICHIPMYPAFRFDLIFFKVIKKLYLIIYCEIFLYSALNLEKF